MRLLDYVFYRIYLYMKNQKEAPVATASLAMTIFFAPAFPLIWIGVPFLIVGWVPETRMEYAVVVIIIFFVIYSWYKTKEDKIVQKYKFSKYNKKISYSIILILLYIISFVLFLLQMPVFGWLKDNHYEGIVGKWLLGLFQ